MLCNAKVLFFQSKKNRLSGAGGFPDLLLSQKLMSRPTPKTVVFFS